MKTLATLALATFSLALPLSLNAGAAPPEPATIFQNCLLEGKVVADRAEDGNNIVRIDFYKAQPYTAESRCIIDGFLEFTQPKGTLIEELSPGSVVQYRYIKMSNGQVTWQLVGAFI